MDLLNTYTKGIKARVMLLSFQKVFFCLKDLPKLSGSCDRH